MSSKYDDDDDESDNVDVYRSEAKSSSQRVSGSKHDDDDIQNKTKLSDDELIAKVQSYFYEDNEFASTFENFVKEECAVIDLDSTEYRLEYTEVFNRYRSLFEDLMEQYIESIGSTVLDFYRALKAKSDEDSETSAAIFGQILVSVTEFDIFMQMMNEAAYKRAQTSKK